MNDQSTDSIEGKAFQSDEQLLSKILEDPIFSFEEKQTIHKFYQVCLHHTSTYGLDDQFTFNNQMKLASINLFVYHKDIHTIQALWVIFLFQLRKHLPPSSLKYQTLDQFNLRYLGAFDNLDIIEQTNLWQIANWMSILFKMIPARKNKGLAIQVIPKLIEGWSIKYVTGSGQTKATRNRVLIFETEGGVHARQRTGSRKESKDKDKERDSLGSNGSLKKGWPKFESEDEEDISDQSRERNPDKARKRRSKTNTMPSAFPLSSSCPEPSSRGVKKKGTSLDPSLASSWSTPSLSLASPFEPYPYPTNSPSPSTTSSPSVSSSSPPSTYFFSHNDLFALGMEDSDPEGGWEEEEEGYSPSPSPRSPSLDSEKDRDSFLRGEVFRFDDLRPSFPSASLSYLQKPPSFQPQPPLPSYPPSFQSYPTPPAWSNPQFAPSAPPFPQPQPISFNQHLQYQFLQIQQMQQIPPSPFHSPRPQTQSIPLPQTPMNVNYSQFRHSSLSSEIPETKPLSPVPCISSDPFSRPRSTTSDSLGENDPDYQACLALLLSDPSEEDAMIMDECQACLKPHPRSRDSPPLNHHTSQSSSGREPASFPVLSGSGPQPPPPPTTTTFTNQLHRQVL